MMIKSHLGKVKVSFLFERNAVISNLLQLSFEVDDLFFLSSNCRGAGSRLLLPSQLPFRRPLNLKQPCELERGARLCFRLEHLMLKGHLRPVRLWKSIQQNSSCQYTSVCR